MRQEKDIHIFLKQKLETVSFEAFINLLFLLTTISGAGISIYMNYADRSLWLDEAFLAYSFSTRSFWQLGIGSLERAQSAPLGWLYFEKILALTFGNTEFVVRIGSIAGFIFTLILLYSLMKRCFHSSFPFAACAFYSNMPFALAYSNVFKPYICDGFFVLLVIFLFYLYQQKKINVYMLAVCWAVFIWFSNPVCFFEGGLLICEAVFAAVEKNWGKIKGLFLTGVSILASFLIYYFFWLREVAVGDVMQNYWAGQNFPLFPASFEDLDKMKNMIKEIFQNLGIYRYIFLFLMAGMLIAAFIKKSRILIGCYFGILITCFASYINMYPVEDRLWCFLYPIIIMIGFWGLEEICKCRSIPEVLMCSMISSAFVFFHTYHKAYAGLAFFIMLGIGEIVCIRKHVNIQIYLAGLAAFVLIFSNNGILHYSNKENVYWRGEELNPEIAYLQENIEEDEMVYVFEQSVPGFEYKNGYGNHSIGGYEDNVILGQTWFQEGEECSDEIEKVVGNDKTYIVFSHSGPELLRQLLDAIHETGYLQLVLYDYNTPLWFYCNSLDDSKVHVSYEMINRWENGKMEYALLRIHNDGNAYLNHMFETVSLVNCSDGHRMELEKNIAPGGAVDVVIEREAGSSSKFCLKNEYGLICEDSEFSFE